MQIRKPIIIVIFTLFATFIPIIQVSAQCGGAPTVTNSDTSEIFCTIQAAIDDADTANGHTLRLSSGTFNENVTLNKAVDLIGAGNGSDPASSSILRKSTNTAILTLQASGSSGDPIVIDALRIEPVEGYGLEVPGGASVDYLNVTGTSFSGNQVKGIYVEKLSNSLQHSRSGRLVRRPLHAYTSVVYVDLQICINPYKQHE